MRYGWLGIVALVASACVDKSAAPGACDPNVDDNCNIQAKAGCSRDADCGDGRCQPDGTCAPPATAQASNACQNVSCPAGRFCSNGQCLLASAQCTAADPACIFIPHGAFEQPAHEWWWPFNTPLGPAGPNGARDFRTDVDQPDYVQVMSTPVVMRLHPADAAPAVVFNTFTSNNSGAGQFLESQGVMRAIRGSDASHIWTAPVDVLNHLDQSVNANSGIASGDCMGTGETCFITGGWDPTDVDVCSSSTGAGTCSKSHLACNLSQGQGCVHSHEHGGLIAFGSDGRFLWSTRAVQVWWGAPAIARLLGATGPAQVVVGNGVIDAATGKTLCAQNNENGAVGNNGEGSLTTLADVDLDGVPEILTGNQAYKLVPDSASATGFTCRKLFGTGVQMTGGRPCAGGVGTLCPDGFPAIASFAGYGAKMGLAPNDPHPQIAVVSQGFLSIHDWTGGLLLEPIAIPTHTTGPNCDPTNNPGGPPTIADFDGLPEVGIASESSYSVWKPGVGFIWSTPTYDCSASTGSSVFDFEGKGNPTVVYSDQCTFQVLDGAHGTQLINENNSSCTAYEMPVVADIDGSGRAKILVPNNDVCEFPCTWGDSLGSGNVGLKALKSPTDKWVNTRSVWNEHTYHVSNVNLDGTLPFPEPQSWAAPQSNSFRQNVQGQGVFSSPDLSICEASVDMTNCASTGATVSAVVYNGGAVVAQPGATVDFYAVLADGSQAHIAQKATTKTLKPGDSESVSATWIGAPQTQSVSIKAVVDQGAVIGDCHPENNAASTSATVKCSPLG